jgi:futalosine hydrolase
MKVLVVTAVEAERAAIVQAGCTAEVVVVGAGPAEAAAHTSARLSGGSYDLVLCAGIAGGFAPLGPGDIAVAATIVFADLGAQTPADGAGFTPVDALGFGVVTYSVSPNLAVELADRSGGHLGAVLTVATVTGTADAADALLRRYPDAVAEAMEGAGVAAAATAHGIAFGEIRAISNLVGPRDRDAWQIPRALDSLGRAVTAVTA